MDVVEKVGFHVVGEDGELAVAGLVDGVATLAWDSPDEHLMMRGEREETGGDG
jgi:hypothetical protein